jgi:hypothetical protein
VPDESGNYKIFILAEYNTGINSRKVKEQNEKTVNIKLKPAS